MNEPVGDEELSRAKGYLIGTQAVSLQRFGAQAMQLSLDDLYGLGATHHLDYGARISAVTAADVQRVAKRVIRLDAPVWRSSSRRAGSAQAKRAASRRRA